MALKKQKERNAWIMPAWMEPYRDLIVNTGGNPVEFMVNDQANPRINLPLSTLEACVKSQVHLLNILHDRGLLARPSNAKTGE